VASWSIQPFGHNTPTLQSGQTGQQSHSIGRTVTYNGPLKNCPGYMEKLPFLNMVSVSMSERDIPHLLSSDDTCHWHCMTGRFICVSSSVSKCHIRQFEGTSYCLPLVSNRWVSPGLDQKIPVHCSYAIFRCLVMTTTTTTIVLRSFVRDYPDEPVPEKTFTHPPSWSSSSQLPFTTIHSILSGSVVK